ncbi:hypothetical protein [Enterobacter sp. BNK-9]|uniref:hypothetical protein n=1 Tax=Enterobacter sp. BNK-9 TaxID=3376146 RepID=UPI003B438ECD
MPVSMERLDSLWRELGNIVVTEKEDVLIISEPFIHFPTGTAVFDIWTWFEASNEDFVVARELYG